MTSDIMACNKLGHLFLIEVLLFLLLLRFCQERRSGECFRKHIFHNSNDKSSSVTINFSYIFTLM